MPSILGSKQKRPLAGKNTLGLRPRAFSAGLGAFSALNLGFRGIFCRKHLQARPISSTKRPQNRVLAILFFKKFRKCPVFLGMDHFLTLKSQRVSSDSRNRLFEIFQFLNTTSGEKRAQLEGGLKSMLNYSNPSKVTHLAGVLCHDRGALAAHLLVKAGLVPKAWAI